MEPRRTDHPQGQEILVAYLYDGQGNPRWLTGSRTFDATRADATFPLEQITGGPRFNGFNGWMNRTVVGQGVRRYAANAVEMLGVTADFASPLKGEWVESLPVALLSERKLCR